MVCYFEWDANNTKRTSTKQRMAMKGPNRKETHPRTKNSKPKSGRESIESFVVVFLCFLIWSLEAEGFVIPTGSMAPTLMGRHKEIACPECDYVYTVNADREIGPTAKENNAGRRIRSGTCENCRFEASVADSPSFSGDRIYVMKNGLSLPFFGAPGRVKLKRWDVAVFKLPEEPEVRYIKRLVGMPNEVIRMDGGDLWVQPEDRSREFERLRRPPNHQEAMQLMVFDDRHRARALAKDPLWLRWVPGPGSDWLQPQPGVYSPRNQPEDGWAELRYHHVVPSPAQWEAIRSDEPLPRPPLSSLITDYYSYNTDVSAHDQSYPTGSARAWFQPHWVGDLTIALRLTVRERIGQFRVELIKAGVSNRYELDLASGLARLYHGTSALGDAVLTGISQAGTYDVVFANVDGRLTLWVDGRLPFGEGRTYDGALEPAVPTAADLEPARVAARDAAISVENLVLRRDIYYTLEPTESDYSNLDGSTRIEPTALLELLSDPARFTGLVRYPARDYSIGPKRYLMLGDNSPWSRDGRAWGNSDQIDPEIPGQGWDSSGRASWEVPESLLIGKAFCVYWPHAKPVWPKFPLSPDTRLPIRPYIERMRWIR
jgi:signal peptidase I